IALWKACECRLGMPGSCQPRSTRRTRGEGSAARSGMATDPVAGCDRLARRRRTRSPHAPPHRRHPSGPRPMSVVDARWDGLLVGARLATLDDASGGYGLVQDGALGWRDGRIVFAGPASALPAAPADLADDPVDAAGDLVTP